MAARPRSTGAQVARDLQPELQDPSPDRLVRNIEAAFCQELLDVAVAEREAQLEPDVVADHVRRERVSGIRDGRHFELYRPSRQPSAFP